MNYSMPGYEDFELSTQLIIKEAVYRNLSVEILDRAENFIRISGNGKMEYVKQATKTGIDSYITFLIMENKLVSKQILSEAGLSVPIGGAYTDFHAACDAYDVWKNYPVVIKPNSTNFGKGVHVLKANNSVEQFQSAVENAFSFDNRILIEEYFHGKEYRFLVVGDYVRAVLHRVPANIVGDGISDIETLVKKKNADPLRGSGYVSPLETIKTGETEQEYLKKQGMDFLSVPARDQKIFLRENSNISTGGDSIDFTDVFHQGYKDLAVAAAKAAGAEICGVDIIVSDIEAVPDSNNYSVIEVNFNPALHIHDFPYQGKNRKVEKAVLDALGF